MKVCLIIIILPCTLIAFFIYSKLELSTFSLYSIWRNGGDNDQAVNFIRDHPEKLSSAGCARRRPSALLEQNRRHISNTVKDQWLFLRSQIRLIQRLLLNVSMESDIQEKYENSLHLMIAHGSEYARVLDLEINKLANLDGWNEWRKNESRKLKRIVRNRIHTLQNPKNCSSVPMLACNLTNPSGFASGAHDVLWCFIKAFKEKKRLVLHSSHWHYAAPGGWETLFKPLNDSCPSHSTTADTTVTLKNDNKVRWLLRTLPEDLAPKMIFLYGNPLAWWYGQFLAYLMRPNLHLQLSIENLENMINFSSPIVGVHVRRTDKVGTEAKSHDLEEYMEHVENYFLSLELETSQIIQRRVFLATDDPNVLTECSRKFPNYECLYNPESASSASKVETRYNNVSLWNLVLDVFALSKTDYIVCTFSSGMCRLAFELKHAIDDKSVDVSRKAVSLDILHHYAWVTPPARKAIYSHVSKSPREIPFEKGDVLIYKNEYSTVNAALKGKTANGFLRMISNKNEILEGFVPAYKTRETFQLTTF